MEIPEWIIKILPKFIRRELYWQRIERRAARDAKVDPIALKAAKAIKRALPNAFVSKIRDNCYQLSYGWAYAFVDANGVLVREWGGYHKPDATEDIVKALIEQDAYWVNKHGHTLDYEHHRASKSKYGEEVYA